MAPFGHHGSVRQSRASILPPSPLCSVGSSPFCAPGSLETTAVLQSSFVVVVVLCVFMCVCVVGGGGQELTCVSFLRIVTLFVDKGP